MVCCRIVVVALAALSVRLVEGDNRIDCIVNTGGGCASSACYDWRGPTDCNAGRCFCKPDSAGAETCAVVAKADNGKDDQVKCEHTKYGRPANATKYRLKNARWSDYYIDVDSFGSVDVESMGADENDNKFTISQPTSGSEAPLFLIASVQWPDSVLRVYKGGSSDRRFQTALQNVNGGLKGMVPDPSIKEVGMMITVAPMGAPGANETDFPFMLSSYNWPNEYLYCTTFRWSVDVHRDDPGAGGYWFFDPPLPPELVEKLPKYKGKRCSINCGEVSAAARLGGAQRILAAAIVAAVAGFFLPASL